MARNEDLTMENMEQHIRELTEKIVEDYGKGRYIDKTNAFNCPDKDAVVDILKKLQRIIFPGFFKSKEYRYYTVENSTSTIVEDVLFNLTKQVNIALRYSPDFENTDCDQVARRAQDISMAFLERIPAIRAFIETDLQAEFDGDPAAYNKDEIIFSYPGFYAIMVYRIAHELVLMKVPMLPRIMTEYAHSLTGIDINPGATIGKYFFIDHGTGIVIGETTLIGDNVKVYQGVTLGALSTSGGRALHNVRRHPTIEDNVTIYSGASILGGDTVIGKGSVIGGNVFLTKSVAPGTKVSVKNQELRYNTGSKKVQEVKDDADNAAWFYVI